jgi:hypothetical protein
MNRKPKSHKMRLGRIRDEEWVMKIAELPSELQQPVACIVWWDFFADRPVPQRTPHFDRWVFSTFPRQEPPLPTIATALETLGYEPEEATRRAGVNSSCLVKLANQPHQPQLI